jgi:hypothetical protein
LKKIIRHEAIFGHFRLELRRAKRIT